MTDTLITLNKKDGTSGLVEAKNLIKIMGTITSPIQLRGEETPEPYYYYYSFIRLKGQTIDLPVIFKIKKSPDLFVMCGSFLEPKIPKGSVVILAGNYSNSEKNIRKSFTAYSYQFFNEKKIRKKCFGCLDSFTCSQSENYDFCKNCELNGSRYVSKSNKCPECGNGSGIIKFPNQPPRSCKTCHLDKAKISDQAKAQLPEFEKELEQITQTQQKLTSHE